MAVAFVGTGCGAKAKTSKAPVDPSLRIGLKRLSTLDPAQASTEEQELVAKQLFDTLTKYDEQAGRALPGLASSWVASADLKEWDFQIRASARFSNEKPVTASDAKFTLDRIVRMGSKSPVGDVLQDVAGFADAGPNGSAEGLAGVTAPADDHLHISLTRPLAELPVLLAYPSFGVVSATSVQESPPGEFAEFPVTSGAYLVHGRSHNVIGLNAAPGRHVRTRSVILVQFDQEDQAFASLNAGALDWVRVPGDVQTVDGKRFRLTERPYLASYFFAFNIKSPKLADERFREAMIHAVDRKAVLDAIHKNTFAPLDGIVVQRIAGAQPTACAETCTFSPYRAKAMLNEVFGQAGPPHVNLDYDSDPTQQAVAKTIQAQLSDVGIVADLHEVPADDYGTFAVSGNEELFRFGWVAGYAGAGAFLRPLFWSASDSNATGLADPTVDAQLDAARIETNETKRAAIYAEVEKSVMSKAPVIPIAQVMLRFATSKRVAKLSVNPDGTFDASTVKINSHQ